jgi:hypothetical protein
MLQARSGGIGAVNWANSRSAGAVTLVAWFPGGCYRRRYLWVTVAVFAGGLRAAVPSIPRSTAGTRTSHSGYGFADRAQGCGSLRRVAPRAALCRAAQALDCASAHAGLGMNGGPGVSG